LSNTVLFLRESCPKGKPSKDLTLIQISLSLRSPKRTTMKLANRTVLLTGGTGGIGLGLAEAFHRSKSRVIVCGRDREKLSLVERKFPEITALHCDVADARQRKNLAAEVLHRFPELDTLVNNAGIQRYIISCSMVPNADLTLHSG
jgi:NAD(P)-dependent dehydrogenase (short-subunit alcohol dehydrogenase family)